MCYSCLEKILRRSIDVAVEEQKAEDQLLLEVWALDQLFPSQPPPAADASDPSSSSSSMTLPRLNNVINHNNDFYISDIIVLGRCPTQFHCVLSSHDMEPIKHLVGSFLGHHDSYDKNDENDDCDDCNRMSSCCTTRTTNKSAVGAITTTTTTPRFPTPVSPKLKREYFELLNAMQLMTDGSSDRRNNHNHRRLHNGASSPRMCRRGRFSSSRGRGGGGGGPRGEGHSDPLSFSCTVLVEQLISEWNESTSVVVINELNSPTTTAAAAAAPLNDDRRMLRLRISRQRIISNMRRIIRRMEFVDDPDPFGCNRIPGLQDFFHFIPTMAARLDTVC